MSNRGTPRTWTELLCSAAGWLLLPPQGTAFVGEPSFWHPPTVSMLHQGCNVCVCVCVCCFVRNMFGLQV